MTRQDKIDQAVRATSAVQYYGRRHLGNVERWLVVARTFSGANHEKAFAYRFVNEVRQEFNKLNTTA